MGNMLLDMMGLLTRKKVTKTGEDQDFLVLGKTPKLDVDMMFTAPKMHNELIRLKDLKAYFDVGEITGNGSPRSIAYFSDASTLDFDGDADFVYIEGTNTGGQPVGRMGLGTSSPNFKLDIAGGDLRIEDNNGIRFGGTGSNNSNWRIFTTGTNSGTLAIGNNGSDPYLTINKHATSNATNIIGKIEFNKYGSGNFTGTAAYNLSVDSSGNVIETAAGGGGTTLTGGNLITVSGGAIDHGTPTFTGTSAGSAINLTYGQTIDPLLIVGQDPNNTNLGFKLDQFGHVTGFQSRALQMPSWLGITNVALNGTDLDFTSTASAEGGFNASVDLSSLSGGIVETTGSWTPIVGTTDPADFVISSYQIQQGHWVRHGNLVTVDFTIQVLATAVSAASGSTSALFVHGWPFDALGAGASIQAPFLDFVDGFDVEVKSTTINTTNDPAIIGGLRLLLMKQHPGVTNYVAFQNLYAGEFSNGNYFRIFGSMTYYTTNTTLNTGATQLP